MDKKTFLEKAKAKHTKNYDYSRVPEKVYAKDIIEIKCPEHGWFKKRCDMFLFGNECQICSRQNLTTEQYIENARKVHGDRYDYSQTVYVNSMLPVKIICHEKDENGKEHGEFMQIARNHTQGAGCPKCSGNKKLDTQSAIEKAKEVHDKKRKALGLSVYDYSMFALVNNSKDETVIICHEKDIFGNEHGEFIQRIGAHLNGSGCPKCMKNSKVSQEEFIYRAKEIQDKRRKAFGLPVYDYSKSIFTGMNNLIEIICPLHGSFHQIAYNHLSDREGCQFCSMNGISRLELELRNFIKSIYKDKIIFNFKFGNKELDIYLPKEKLGFEFNGLYWHSEEFREQFYHKAKTDYFESQGIHLIQIFEDEWLNNQNIIESRIKYILHKNIEKIYARKCIIQEINEPQIERLFLQTNHLQGYVASNVCLGLFYDDLLVALMSFGKQRKIMGKNVEENKFELLRFANILDKTVIGGAQKLFKYFLEKYSPNEIISYADRKWSINNEHNLYNQLGFEYQNVTVPNYYYIINPQQKVHRFSMRKDILVSKYGCPPEMSEHEFCLSKGWFRIYDCGNLKYIWQAK